LGGYCAARNFEFYGAAVESSSAPPSRWATLLGKLPPGTRLDEKQLAERFNVSRTPVREALWHPARRRREAAHFGRARRDVSGHV
jgi:hypothetical protein